ncbi:MAG TPA: hypothetical protein VJ912_03935 [Candidatus Nanoarchaeia archaeon]|nr:hypothetical protein [Candidatus Nanoarchaeia archaeon]
MKIGIDIDDVIAEFRKGFLRYYQKKKDFDINRAYVVDRIRDYFINKEEVGDEIENFHFTEEFENLEIVKGSEKSINLLYKENQITFITARPKEHSERTKRFINKYFPENLKIIHSEEAENFSKKRIQTKGDICEIEKIDIMIEDKPCYAIDCAKRGVFVFILERPWNKHYNFRNYNNIEIVKDWNEIFNKINKMKIKNNENKR